MKCLNVLFVLISLVSVGCASSAKIMSSPCDTVMNRQDIFVCGKDDVMKKCRSVIDRKELVCDKL